MKPDGVEKLPSASICFSVATRFGNVITGYGAEKLTSLHKRAKFSLLWRSRVAAATSHCESLFAILCSRESRLGVAASL